MTIEYKCLEARKEWDQADVDSYLIQKGFSRDKLARIRSIESCAEQLEEAGKAFARLDWHDFSQTQLAMVTVPWEMQKKRNVVSGKLTRTYREERDQLNEEGLNTNCMQLLRENTGNYHGNLRQARGVWPKFIPQTRDWKNDIILPLSIDRRVAQLLGIIWVDGAFNLQKDATNPDRVTVQGREADIELYDSFVLPNTEGLFNYHTTVKIEKKVGDMSKIKPSNRRKYDCEFPVIKICSTAITTWLYHDLGFRLLCNEIDRDLPDLNWGEEDVRQGFLEGVIAGRGGFSVSNKNMRFLTSQEPLTEAIKELLRMNDVEFSQVSNRGVYIWGEATRELIDNYNIVNPKHRGYTNQIIAMTSEKHAYAASRTG